MEERSEIWYNKSRKNQRNKREKLRTTNNRQGRIELVCIEDLVPQDHLLRKIDKHIDFTFINELCRPYYCEDNGRPAIEPVIMFKMLFIDYPYGIRSESRLVEEVKVNMAYRWFLGYGIEDKIPEQALFGRTGSGASTAQTFRAGYLMKY